MKTVEDYEFAKYSAWPNLILGSFGLANGQCTYLDGCQPDGDEIACPNGMNNCCQTLAMLAMVLSPITVLEL